MMKIGILVSSNKSYTVALMADKIPHIIKLWKNCNFYQ